MPHPAHAWRRSAAARFAQIGITAYLTNGGTLPREPADHQALRPHQGAAHTRRGAHPGCPDCRRSRSRLSYRFTWSGFGCVGGAALSAVGVSTSASTRSFPLGGSPNDPRAAPSAGNLTRRGRAGQCIQTRARTATTSSTRSQGRSTETGRPMMPGETRSVTGKGSRGKSGVGEARNEASAGCRAPWGRRRRGPVYPAQSVTTLCLCAAGV